MAISPGASGLPGVDSAFDFDFQRAIALYRNLGVQWEYLGIDGGSDVRSIRERAIKAIRASINRDRPVAAYGLNLSEFGIIKGYDDGADSLFVRTVVSAQYGERLPFSQWPAPGNAARFQILVPGGGVKVKRSEALRLSLRFAVGYARLGDAGGPATGAHGLSAFSKWMQAFTQPGRLICPATLVPYRSCDRPGGAARYLLGIAPEFPDRDGGILLSAASEYQHEALAASRLATLFPFPSGGDIDNPASLRSGEAALREAFDCEQRAIMALEAIEGESVMN